MLGYRILVIIRSRQDKMTRKIPLGNKNKFALVDVDDFLKVAQFTWHESICGGAQRRPRKDGKRGCEFLHYRILDIVGKKKLRVKHLNGNRLDCRQKNMIVEKR